MGRIAQVIVIGIAGVGLLVSLWTCSIMGSTAADTGSTSPKGTEYQKWITQHEQSWQKGCLIVTAVEGEDRSPGSEFSFDSATTYGCVVADTGAVSHFLFNSMGAKGGSGFTIAPADFGMLKELLTALPDDGSKLPPAGRRLLIHAGSAVRVYDRGNLPDEVIDVIRLSAAGIRAWVLQIKTQSEIDARQFEHGGFMSLSPDGKQILLTTPGGLQLWEPTTHETLDEAKIRNLSGDRIAFSPDGTVGVVAGNSGMTLLALVARRNSS